MSADATITAHATAARPRVVDIATVLVLLAAVLNVVIGVLVAVTAAAMHAVIPPGLIAAVVAISVLYGVCVGVLAVLFRGGRIWARASLVTASALSLFTLFAPNAFNLAVIVLLVVGDVLLYRRSVSMWVRDLRGLPRP